MKVFIPTLKQNNQSIGCVYPNVIAFGIGSNFKPHSDLLNVAYRIEAYEGYYQIGFNGELIHKQHHYNGALKEFLNEKKIAEVCGGVVLSIQDGGIFLNMIKNK